MATRAEIVLDSISPAGIRLTTIAVEFPRFLLAEVGTHRMFSRSFASSRAIPVAETLRRVQEEPFIPIHWGKNQKGMQAAEECNEQVVVDIPTVGDIYDGLIYEPEYFTNQQAWLYARDQAIDVATAFDKAGYHKQLVNRLLEPFSYVTGIITATEWDNFYELRCHKDAQPEFQELAHAMKAAMDGSTPTLLETGEWHLPYVTEEDEGMLFALPSGGEGNLGRIGLQLRMLSAARCARASFASNQRGQTFTIEQDLALYDRLFGPPKHAGPFEHQATPMCDNAWTSEGPGVTHIDTSGSVWSNNFRGWIQNRALL